MLHVQAAAGAHDHENEGDINPDMTRFAAAPGPNCGGRAAAFPFAATQARR
jgi:hypothetical protein